MPAFVCHLSMLVLLLAGCNGEELQEKTVKRRPRGPAVKVSLPPIQDLTPPKYVEVHEDNRLTVEGVLRNRDKYMHKNVFVKGYVLKRSTCTEENLVGDRKVCDPPHFYLVDEKDDQDTKWKLLVTLGSQQTVDERIFEGLRYDIRGRIDTVSRAGDFVNARGLLRHEEDIPLEPLPELPKKKPPKKRKKPR